MSEIKYDIGQVKTDAQAVSGKSGAINSSAKTVNFNGDTNLPAAAEFVREANEISKLLKKFAEIVTTDAADVCATMDAVAKTDSDIGAQLQG